MKTKSSLKDKGEKQDTADNDFEEKVKELEALTSELDSSKISLSASLAKFERGVELYKSCIDFLSNAEKKIAKLSESLEEKKLD